MDTNYYDMEGKPMDLLEWGKALEEGDRHLGATNLWFGKIWVSTVWLGLNHRFTEDGPPLIFETCVFVRKGDSTIVGRYAYKEQAEENHKYWVRRLRNPITALKLILGKEWE